MTETSAPRCEKCGRDMERGLILDRGHYDVATSASTWVEGRKLPGFWSDLTGKGKRRLAVITYRCAGCGYLESYAPPRLFSPPPRD